MIHFGMMAMKAEMGIEELKEMLFAHPTLSEAFYEAALDTDNEAIHIVKA
jgi:dihydrolipoamide dehydrogenase